MSKNEFGQVWSGKWPTSCCVQCRRGHLNSDVGKVCYSWSRGLKVTRAIWSFDVVFKRSGTFRVHCCCLQQRPLSGPHPRTPRPWRRVGSTPLQKVLDFSSELRGRHSGINVSWLCLCYSSLSPTTLCSTVCVLWIPSRAGVGGWENNFCLLSLYFLLSFPETLRSYAKTFPPELHRLISTNPNHHGLITSVLVVGVEQMHRLQSVQTESCEASFYWLCLSHMLRFDEWYCVLGCHLDWCLLIGTN